MIGPQVQAEILQRVTTLLTDNINDLIPDLPALRENVSKVTETSTNAEKGGSKTRALAQDALSGIEELKGEFEYLKTRFSP